MDAEIQECHQALLDSEPSFEEFINNALMETTTNPPPNTTTPNTTSPVTPIDPNSLPALPYEPLDLSIPDTEETTPNPASNPPQPSTPTSSSTHMPLTSTPTQSTNQTTTTFDKLVELNHSKHNHQHHINILQKHISKQTSPKGLTIHIKPWVQLSPEHQDAWNASIHKCMSELTTILHQHHVEELAKIDDKISSTSSSLHTNHSPEVTNTIIQLASRTKQHIKHKPSTKHHIKSSTTQITIAPTSEPPTKRHKPRHHHTKQPNFHHGPQRQKHTHTPPITKSTLPLRPSPIPQANIKPVIVQPTPPHPPPIVTTSTIQQRLVGKEKEFPTIYRMFMKGGQ